MLSTTLKNSVTGGGGFSTPTSTTSSTLKQSTAPTTTTQAPTGGTQTLQQKAQSAPLRQAGTTDRYGITTGGQTQQQTQQQPLQQAEAPQYQALDPTAGAQLAGGEQAVAQMNMQSAGLGLPGYDTGLGRLLWTFGTGGASTTADIATRVFQGDSLDQAIAANIGTGADAIIGDGADAAQTIIDEAMPSIEDLLSTLVGAGTNIWQTGEQAWQEGMGPAPNISDQIQQILAGFGYTPTSLAGDVGQNWTSAMDPAAWEQMAANRMDAAREEARGSMNEAERRMRGAAARGGFNANPGLGGIYSDYAGAMQDAQRNIFNDTLTNQMNALQGASSYALGQQGLDLQHYGQLLNPMIQAAMQQGLYDQNNYTSFGEAVGGVADIIGSLTGGAANAGGQAAGGIGNLLGGLIGAGIIGLPFGV